MATTRLLFEREDGTWGWHLTGEDNEVIATTGDQWYDNEDDARSIADRIIAGEFKRATKKILRRSEQ